MSILYTMPPILAKFDCRASTPRQRIMYIRHVNTGGKCRRSFSTGNVIFLDPSTWRGHHVHQQHRHKRHPIPARPRFRYRRIRECSSGNCATRSCHWSTTSCHCPTTSCHCATTSCHCAATSCHFGTTSLSRARSEHCTRAIKMDLIKTHLRKTDLRRT